ncbi:cytochrome P450 [Streptomyces decoyicus]|uniref:cytochrome P450 n=1 Tax=Streptomyces decoyicus TaxID=249567 RepID=UPI0033B4E0D9
MDMTSPDVVAPMALEDIDLFDPTIYRTGAPHAALRTLRLKASVWHQARPGQPAFWSLTKYQNVAAALKNTAAFSSTHGNNLDIAETGDSAGGHTLPLMDPPDHGLVRGPSIRTLSNLVMRDRTEPMRAKLRELLAPCLRGEDVDLAHLLLDLPMLAVGDIIGIPESVWPEIPSLTMAGIAPKDPIYSAGSDKRTLAKAHMRLFSIFAGLLADRRQVPQEDFVSVLSTLDFGGRKLTDQQVMMNCYSMVMGANTSTPYVAAHFVLAMAQNPSVWERIRADPGLIDSAVTESLRWATPANHVMRKVTTDTEVEGHTLKAGSIVALWIASANRDETVFTSPYEFDPGRAPNPHLAFALGPHYCVGAPAVKTALRLFIEELAYSVRSFELIGPVHHLSSNFINGITTLPVRFQLSGT